MNVEPHQPKRDPLLTLASWAAFGGAAGVPLVVIEAATLRSVLSRNWMQLGVLFGIALGLVAVIEFLHLQTQYASVGLITLLGSVVWQTKIGVTLGRNAKLSAT